MFALLRPRLGDWWMAEALAEATAGQGRDEDVITELETLVAAVERNPYKRRAEPWKAAEFLRQVGAQYPAFVRLWTNAWAEMVPFRAFDVEIRRIERLNAAAGTAATLHALRRTAALPDGRGSRAAADRCRVRVRGTPCSRCSGETARRLFFAAGIVGLVHSTRVKKSLGALSIGGGPFRSPGERPARSRSTQPPEGIMTTTVNTARAAAPTFGALIGTGVVAAVVASGATMAVAAAGHGAGISLDMSAQPIPVAGFGVLTAIFSLVGVGLAAVLARVARRPRRAFVRTTVVLTALSLVPDVIADAAAATKALLMLTHLVAAAIVIPAVARRLAA